MAWTVRYVRSDAAGGGDGTTDTNSGGTGAFTLAEAITHSTTNTSIQYRVKSGTYANTTTSRTFSGAGTTTAPNWWRGFNTTAGDLDGGGNSLAMPTITFTTGVLTVTGAYQTFSGISFQVNRDGVALAVTTGVGIKFHRCRVENTNAGTSARAVNANIAMVDFSECWFKVATTSISCVNVPASANAQFTGCTFVGGQYNLSFAAGGRARRCLFRNANSHAVYINTSATTTIIECSVYNAGGDGIRFDTLPNTNIQNSYSDNVFSVCGAYGINNATGADTNLILVRRNTYHSCTSGSTNGLGDSFLYLETTDSSSPFVDAAGANFALATTSNAVQTAAPGSLENETTVSYSDRGVAQQALASVTVGALQAALSAAILTTPGNRLATDANGLVGLQSGTGTGQLDFTSGVVKSNVTQLLGTAWLTPGTAGTPDVNVKLWNGLTTVALPLTPTTAGRTLDVSAGGEAGIDWANVGSPTTTLALTGTTIATTQKVDVETIKTNPVVNGGTVTFPTGATLASTTNITAGTITTATNVTTVNGLAAGVITATSIASDAITDAKVASDVTIASVTGAVGSVTGNVGGNVTGSVGSVVGNVGGNVVGSVATLTNDPTGVTTLLSRLSSSRAGYLDNLNVGGAVASQADVTAINQSASRRILVATVGQYERPESGSVQYSIEVRTFDGDGAATSADSTPSVGVVGIVSGSLAANLGAGSQIATGVYQYLYTVSSAATVEEIRVEASATISATTFTIATFTQVADFVSSTWTTADRTKLEATYNKLPSKAYLAGTDNSSGAVEASAMTGNFAGSVGSVAGSVAGSVGSLATQAKADVNAEVDTAISDAALATAANLATVAGYLDTEIAAILADTNELQTDWANGGRLDLILDARASQTSVDDIPTNSELTTAVGSVTLADGSLTTAKLGAFTLAKTTNITGFNDIAATAVVSGGAIATSGGSVSRVTLVDTLTTYTGNTPQTGDGYAILSSGTYGNAALKTLIDALDDYVDSEVAAIKAKTDQLTFTSENKVDATLQAAADLATAVAQKVAHVVLRRTMANVEAASDGDTLALSSLYGLVQMAQESSINDTTMTVKQTDGSTELGTKTVTIDPTANPITGVS